MIETELGIIAGTGLYQLDKVQNVSRKRLTTRWGEPSSQITLAQYGAENGKHTVAFLARHGETHTIPPHKVNYRANLWALKELGVKRIIAVAAVGGINERMPPGQVIIPDQIIDYTYGRSHTYFEEDLEQVTHVDFTSPYTETLRQSLVKAGKDIGLSIVDTGVYAATQGPRLETAAEIQRLRRDGSDIVGMTGMPEAVLARELGLEYACCALVVNWAAGCAGTQVIDHDEMQAVIDAGMGQIRGLIQATIGSDQG